LFSDVSKLMMPGHRQGISPHWKSFMAARPAPYTCIACIKESAHALSNVERLMAGQEGDAVGLKIRTAGEARRWIQSLDLGRCPCLTVRRNY
jgi:hypothetical protein